MSTRRIESDIPRNALQTIQAGTVSFTYKGVLCQKNPFDLALYARLLWETGARGVLEVGSSAGGSALWFADTLRAYERSPTIVSVDINPVAGVEDHDIEFLQGDALRLGDTLDDKALARIPRPMLIVEDSAHTFDVTTAVLDFADTVLQPGEYIVVEDGIVNDLGEDYSQFQNGPNRAVLSFLDRVDGRYEIDTGYCDYFGHNFTWNTNGWLRRTDAPAP